MGRTAFRIALSTLLLLTAGAGAATAAPVDVRVVAEGRWSADGRGGTPRYSGLAAGWGTVAWVETRGGRERLIARTAGRLRRGAWTGRDHRDVRLERGVDAQSGRTVVRLLADACRQERGEQRCTASSRSPRTLRALRTSWTVAPEGETAIDGPAALTLVEPATPAAAPTCGFTAAGFAAPPPLPSCAGGSVRLRGAIAGVAHGIPGPPDVMAAAGALELADLAAAQPAWVRVADGGSDRSGSHGLQRWCLTDGGAAVLAGSTDDYGFSDEWRETWAVEVHALRAGAPSWQASAAALLPPSADAGDPLPELACDGDRVYALHTAERGAATPVRSSRIVELRAPADALPAAR